MKLTTRALFTVLIAFGFTRSAIAQKFFDFSFEKYPVTKIYKGPKANVNLKSCETARRYRTQIKRQYGTSGIDFAGKYSLVFWEAGTGGLTLGAMVDNRTGIVYDLPLTVENSNRGCWSSDMNFENNIIYTKTSKLFITWTCQEKIKEAAKSNVVTKYYSIFLWNETRKIFILLKNKREIITENSLIEK